MVPFVFFCQLLCCVFFFFSCVQFVSFLINLDVTNLQLFLSLYSLCSLNFTSSTILLLYISYACVCFFLFFFFCNKFCFLSFKIKTLFICFVLITNLLCFTLAFQTYIYLFVCFLFKRSCFFFCLFLFIMIYFAPLCSSIVFSIFFDFRCFILTGLLSSSPR